MNGGTALEKDRSAVLIPYWFMYFNKILRQQEIKKLVVLRLTAIYNIIKILI